MQTAPRKRTNYQAAPYGQLGVLADAEPLRSSERRKLHELLQEQDSVYHSDHNPLPTLRRWVRDWQERAK